MIYGGSRYGLLGKLCDSIVSNGGDITGIIPHFFLSLVYLYPAPRFHIVVVLGGFFSLLSENDAYSAGCKEIVVPDMHTRKKMMFDRVSHVRTPRVPSKRTHTHTRTRAHMYTRTNTHAHRKIACSHVVFHRLG